MLSTIKRSATAPREPPFVPQIDAGACYHGKMSTKSDSLRSAVSANRMLLACREQRDQSTTRCDSADSRRDQSTTSFDSAEFYPTIATRQHRLGRGFEQHLMLYTLASQCSVPLSNVITQAHVKMYLQAYELVHSFENAMKGNLWGKGRGFDALCVIMLVMEDADHIQAISFARSYCSDKLQWSATDVLNTSRAHMAAV